MTFWWRRWQEQSRTPAAHASPWPSAISCTSMWCALPTIASMKTVPSPNASAASRRDVVERGLELGLLEHLADAAPAAARGGLDHQRVADVLGVLARFLDRLDRAVGPRRDRHAGLLGHQLGLDLVAQLAHHVAGRADEHEAHLLDHVRERGVLGDEAPAGPDGVGLGLDQRPLDALVVEVGARALAVLVDRGGRAEAEGLVGVADEHRAALGLGVERDDPDRVVLALGVQLADGMDETHRGLAAID